MSTTPKIFFFCALTANTNTALLRGGDRVYLQHLKALRSLGYVAYCVNQCSLFNRLLPIKRTQHDYFISKTQFNAIFNPYQDYVVLPGRFLDKLNEFPGNNKILFIQGIYITLNALDLYKPRQQTWESTSLKGIFCVSEGNAAIIQSMKPHCPVYVIPNSAEPNFNGNDYKRNVLIYPSLKQAEKNPLDTKAILSQLITYCHPKVIQQDYSLKELRGLSHSEVLKLMEQAKVLLFLGINEGLPLTILEAMANDVIVIAYNRKPMSDLLHPDCIFEIHQYQAMLKTIHSILFEYETWSTIIAWNRKKVLEYSSKNQTKALHNTWYDLTHLLNQK